MTYEVQGYMAECYDKTTLMEYFDFKLYETVDQAKAAAESLARTYGLSDVRHACYVTERRVGTWSDEEPVWVKYRSTEWMPEGRHYSDGEIVRMTT